MSKSHATLAAAFAGLAIVIPLIVLLFTAPSSHGKPRDLPIGVVGPAATAEQVGQRLDAQQPGGFEVHSYDSEAALVQAAQDREVYGGIVPAVPGAQGAQPKAVVASGASPAVAPMITQMATAMAQGQEVRTVEVAPLSADDPRGAGFGSIVMPVFLSGMVLALSTVLIGGHPKIVAAALPVGAAVVGAAAVGAAMWIGVLPGGFWGQWLAMSAGMLAIGSTVAGLVSLFGTKGIAPAALLFMLIGMPLAGIAMPPEFLPHIWATLGQSLPIGATGTALRSAAFFADGGLIGAGAGAAFAVLGAWVAVGYALLVIGAAKHRAQRGAPSDNTEVSEKDLPQPATI
ncbi:ABC transporter permease [Tsukamurella asaccharolytica]|uniref:ABC transporter permease n=1 Tax=Tsukamurella asaccharolytica TaxID=2592067 RepID=A0A5C5REV7_9ACTN|nr:ABC transporter permease [Tsukamurella asaccharolytica]TWS20625.1 ABC transporter permease [Tsukamurella asaccharolytica]